jgi:hypothetical protein
MSEKASLKCGDHVFCGVVENASLRGMFIRTEHDIPLNIPVEVSVRHASHARADFDACVVRKQHNGLGVMIRRMNINSFVYLRDLVAEQCQNPEVLMHETKTMVGYIISS